jgi:hypothetical protein
MYGLPDPTRWQVWWNDYVRGSDYVAADYVHTLVGTGTHAVTAGEGGWLLSTTSGGATDDNSTQVTPATFTTTAGRRCFFKARVKVDSILLTTFQIGLIAVDTVPMTAGHPVDGIFFRKAATVAPIDVYCRTDATTGSTTQAGAGTMVADTFTILAFYYNGIDEVQFFQDGTQIGSLVANATYLPNTALTPSFSVLNGSGVARAVTLDNWLCATERPNSAP